MERVRRMACSNPEVKGVCELGAASFKKLCTRCKWSVSPEEAEALRKKARYNEKVKRSLKRGK
jgi:hypothetical protein